VYPHGYIPAGYVWNKETGKRPIPDSSKPDSLDLKLVKQSLEMYYPDLEVNLDSSRVEFYWLTGIAGAEPGTVSKLKVGEDVKVRWNDEIHTVRVRKLLDVVKIRRYQGQVKERVHLLFIFVYWWSAKEQSDYHQGYHHLPPLVKKWSQNSNTEVSFFFSFLFFSFLFFSFLFFSSFFFFFLFILFGFFSFFNFY
jgi:hypothetical protein